MRPSAVAARSLPTTSSLKQLNLQTNDKYRPAVVPNRTPKTPRSRLWNPMPKGGREPCPRRTLNVSIAARRGTTPVTAMGLGELKKGSNHLGHDRPRAMTMLPTPPPACRMGPGQQSHSDQQRSQPLALSHCPLTM